MGRDVLILEDIDDGGDIQRNSYRENRQTLGMTE